jgi:hypothetical protein
MNTVLNSHSPFSCGNFAAFGVLQVKYLRLMRCTVLPLHRLSTNTIIAPCDCNITASKWQSPFPSGNFSAFSVLQVNYPRLKRSTVLPLQSVSTITIIDPSVGKIEVWNCQSPFSSGNFSAFSVAYRPPSTPFEYYYNNCPMRLYEHSVELTIAVLLRQFLCLQCVVGQLPPSRKAYRVLLQ